MMLHLYYLIKSLVLTMRNNMPHYLLVLTSKTYQYPRKLHGLLSLPMLQMNHGVYGNPKERLEK